MLMYVYTHIWVYMGMGVLWAFHNVYKGLIVHRKEQDKTSILVA